MQKQTEKIKEYQRISRILRVCGTGGAIKQSGYHLGPAWFVRTLNIWLQSRRDKESGREAGDKTPDKRRILGSSSGNFRHMCSSHLKSPSNTLCCQISVNHDRREGERRGEGGGREREKEERKRGREGEEGDKRYKVVHRSQPIVIKHVQFGANLEKLLFSTPLLPLALVSPSLSHLILLPLHTSKSLCNFVSVSGVTFEAASPLKMSKILSYTSAPPFHKWNFCLHHSLPFYNCCLYGYSICEWSIVLPLLISRSCMLIL